MTASAVKIASAIQGSDVTMSVELGVTEVSARAVLALKVGDLIPIETRPDDPLAVYVEGIHVMTGVPGVSRGNNAVRVVTRAA